MWPRSLPSRPFGTARACRHTPALGLDARSAGPIQNPGPPVYRLRSRSGEGTLLVRHALAAGSDLPGGTKASGIRDAKAGGGFGDTADPTGAVRVVPGAHFVRASGADTGSRCFSVGGLYKTPPTFFDALHWCAKSYERMGLLWNN